MVGSSFYILYCCQLLHTSSVIIYGASVLLGAGAAIIWTSQGFILACHSSEPTLLRCVFHIQQILLFIFGIYRNCGIFWSIFHVSGVIGNLFVLFILTSGEDFDKRTKSLV